MKITSFKDLTKPKQVAVSAIEAHAQARRAQYATPGMDLLYNQKAAEAASFLTNSNGDPANYPMLNAEVGITASTILEVAQIISQAAQRCREASLVIEKARLTAKKQVAAALSAAEIQHVVSNLNSADLS